VDSRHTIEPSNILDVCSSRTPYDDVHHKHEPDDGTLGICFVHTDQYSGRVHSTPSHTEVQNIQYIYIDIHCLYVSFVVVVGGGNIGCYIFLFGGPSPNTQHMFCNNGTLYMWGGSNVFRLVGNLLMCGNVDVHQKLVSTSAKQYPIPLPEGTHV
jgi:hypothetical protein